MVWKFPRLWRSGSSAPAPAVSPKAIAATPHVTPLIRNQGPIDWSDLSMVRSARDMQLRGDFSTPVRLAEAFRTDDALFHPYRSRVAPQLSVPLAWRPSAADTDGAIAARMNAAIQLPAHVRQSLLGTAANHGIAVGYLERSVIDDPVYGPTVQFTLNEWPLEFVKFFPYDNTIKTRTREIASYVTITHGDGFWVVFRKFGMTPWAQDAAVLPAAFVWAMHADALTDWAGASRSHGSPKVVGEMPQGVRVEGDDGAPQSPEAQGFLDMMTKLASGDSPAGIMASGSKVQLLFNGSTAWQVFSELGLDRKRAAARIYCGTDAILGAMGGAPGVDSEQLFDVADTLLESDVEMLERGFYEGIAVPWGVLHGYDKTALACPKYVLPDAEADRKSEEESNAIDRTCKAIASMRAQGLVVAQDTVDQMAKSFGVSTKLTLAAARNAVSLTPTAIGQIVTVNEGRASQGLDPLEDERGKKMIAEVAQASAGGEATDQTDGDPEESSQATDSPPKQSE